MTLDQRTKNKDGNETKKAEKKNTAILRGLLQKYSHPRLILPLGLEVFIKILIRKILEITENKSLQ